MKYIANLFFALASQSWWCSVGGGWPLFAIYPFQTPSHNRKIPYSMSSLIKWQKLYPLERVKECIEMCKERSAEPKSSSEFAKSFRKISCGQNFFKAYFALFCKDYLVARYHFKILWPDIFFSSRSFAMSSKDYHLYQSQLPFHNFPSRVREQRAIKPWNEQVMFRQSLVQAISCSKIFAKSRSKPKFLLRHLKNLFCATTKGDFTAHYWLPRGKKRPQDSLCWAEKPLSLVPFDKYTSQKILFRRLFLAPALKKLYLFGGGRQGGRERGNSLKKDKLRRRRPPL